MKCYLKLLVVLCLALVASTVTTFAQASGSTAELRGHVTDANGAAIPNAKLTLTDTAKGTARTGVSDAEGAYTFLGLLPSVYELKTEAANFTSGLTRLELTVGQQGVADVVLKTGGVSEQIEVVAGTEVVETARTEQSAVIDNKQIANLPINRRNFLDYALLTPGVVDADNIADSSDFRVGQTPQSGLSFGGNNGRGNMVQVDGAETLGSSGGVQATISQEAVQEFQV
ncbi:MAG: carboxypeptidase regulatory-like domain-containing protein, partial [Acidobacteria bacterium]|nr:carboxypeptidase regulatory-like domain-containing protein [Acidobacteriota bacterium]